MLTDTQRDLFDRLLEAEIDALPEHVRALLEEVPVIVEDEPSDALLTDLGMQPGDDLYGLHSGTALTERSVEAPPDLPDQIMLFRGPLFRLAGPGPSLHPTRRKRTKEIETLREQVRITLLHEIGHHFGLDEEDLDRLGYA